MKSRVILRDIDVILPCYHVRHEWCIASSATRNKHETDMISPVQADTAAKVKAKSRIWRIAEQS
jgi:hypothetical protein